MLADDEIVRQPVGVYTFGTVCVALSMPTEEDEEFGELSASSIPTPIMDSLTLLDVPSPQANSNFTIYFDGFFAIEILAPRSSVASPGACLCWLNSQSKRVGLALACSLDEIDWRDQGFDCSGRGWLLSPQAGYFFHDAHQAAGDVDAVLQILHHRTADGTSALTELLAHAGNTSWLISAVGAHFDVKDKLKARGYRWNSEDSVWCKQVQRPPVLKNSSGWLITSMPRNFVRAPMVQASAK